MYARQGPPERGKMSIEKSEAPEAFRDFERNGWNEVGANYAQGFAAFTAEFASPLLEVTSLQPGQKLLDVACGPGQIAGLAISRGIEAAGIDISQEMIDIANTRVPTGTFKVADAEALPFEDNSFDAATCGYGIIHLPNPENALREMARVVKPGGKIAVSVWSAPSPDNGFGVVYDALAQHGDMNVPLPPGPNFFQFSTPDAMIAALSTIGLMDAVATPIERRLQAPSPASFLSSLKDSTVRARSLLLAQTPETITNIEQTMTGAMSSFRAEDSYLIPMPTIIGSGRV